MTLAERIQVALQIAGLKPADLARAAQVSRATVTLWMNGTTQSIDGENLTRAAGALGVSPHWLATGEEAASTYRSPPHVRVNHEINGPQTIFYRTAIVSIDLHDLSVITAEEIMQKIEALKDTFIWISEDDYMATGRMPCPRGYHVVIDPGAQWEYDDIVLARIGKGRPVLRRVANQRDGNYLVTESERLEPVRVEAGDIIGVAITVFPPVVVRRRR